LYFTSSTLGLKRLPSLAGHRDVGQELHFDLHLALALARLAAATRHVEREGAGRQAAAPGVLGGGEQLADRIERLEIGDGVAARRTANRRLIHQHHIGQQLGAFEAAMEAHLAVPVALGALQPGVEHVVHERGLAGAAHAGDTGERVQRKLDVDVLQIVLTGADETDPLR
jgi:hypothetical protein